MKDIVFDINVILDVLLNRNSAAISEQLFELIQEEKIRGWVAASSLPIIEYLIFLPDGVCNPMPLS